MPREENDFYTMVTPTEAVNIAFPELSPGNKRLIAKWYIEDGSEDDFDNNQDFADFIRQDVEEMIDCYDPESDEVRSLIDEMLEWGYIREDRWSDNLEDLDENRRSFVKSRKRFSEAKQEGHIESMVDYFLNYFPEYDPDEIGGIVFTGDDMFGDLENQGLNGYGVWVGYQHSSREILNKKYFKRVTDIVYNEILPAFEEYVAGGLGGDPNKIVVENHEKTYDMYRLYYIEEPSSGAYYEDLLREFVATNCREYTGLIDSYIGEVPNLEDFEDVEDMYQDFIEYAETILPNSLVEKFRKRFYSRSLKEANLLGRNEYCIQIRRPGKEEWLTVNEQGSVNGGRPKTFKNSAEAKSDKFYKKFEENPDWEVRITNNTDR